MRLFLSFAMSLLFLAATTPVDAQLDIFFARADDGSVDVTFDGSGMIGDGIANFLTIGTTNDTFLRDGGNLPFNDSGGSSLPGITLGGVASNGDFYGDLDNFGLNSYIQLNFGSAIPVNSDLSNLNGTFNFSTWRFEDFNPGTFELVSPSEPQFLQVDGVGQITAVVVVPEPTSILVFAVGLVGIGMQRRRR